MTEIKICGLVYQLIHKPSTEMAGRLGLANFNTQEIWILDSATAQTQKIVIVHEILHLLDQAYNLKLSEEQVTYTAHALLALNNDNIDLVKMLAAGNLN